MYKWWFYFFGATLVHQKMSKLRNTFNNLLLRYQGQFFASLLSWFCCFLLKSDNQSESQSKNDVFFFGAFLVLKKAFKLNNLFLNNLQLGYQEQFCASLSVHFNVRFSTSPINQEVNVKMMVLFGATLFLQKHLHQRTFYFSNQLTIWISTPSLATFSTDFVVFDKAAKQL